MYNFLSAHAHPSNTKRMNKKQKMEETEQY